MQGRMKQHPLSAQQIQALLNRVQVGHFSTLDATGAPYTLPVHFVWLEGQVYIHGLKAGEKVENLQRDARACFQVEEMQGLLLDEKPCDVNTAYESVVLRGTAQLVEERERKVSVLREIVRKYVPDLAEKPFPEAMINGTGVIAFTPSAITGKYYA